MTVATAAKRGLWIPSKEKTADPIKVKCLELCCGTSAVTDGDKVIQEADKLYKWVTEQPDG